MASESKKVLIVEDERPLSHALELKLQHEGFDVMVASNGRECLELVESNHFDVILLDLIMPDIDGFQVLTELQKQSKQPTVFVLSNLSQHEDEERVLALGAKKFFIKSDTSLTTIVDEVKSA
jgi:DNA-binding response OmpR family regulator